MRDGPDTVRSPTVREGDIVRAYGKMPRTVQCACGGEITAPIGDEDAIEMAVQRHQDESLHRLWRKWVDARNRGSEGST